MKAGGWEQPARVYQGLINFFVFYNKVTGSMGTVRAVYIACLYFSKSVEQSPTVLFSKSVEVWAGQVDYKVSGKLTGLPGLDSCLWCKIQLVDSN